MHISTPLTLLTLLKCTPILALDYTSTYNLASPTRWDANLIDTPNNISCTITYNDVSSLLIPDSDGYLSSPIPIAIPCSNVNYVARTLVGKNSSVISYSVPGKEVVTFSTGSRSLLGDGEVVQMVFGA
ncbi:0d107ed8-71ee-45e3-a421-4525a40ee865-CDS [Sclerotinia trifoliorum]|uniref:0d107ed8-71ee-45e3-a421-4525a40ee865-CDS n=1 Tax=Sclerotinia trifoliorum TaxID=28548 RepID=A0A8H2W0G7_9HELO|nr:0d107ed8-71ee-45e3-a421-4525a40ee865-CDS [Sclerotinia trifoliorum]